MTDESTPPNTSKELDAVRELILNAFTQAKERGKLDWDQMTVAVLKNRLLGLTKQEFKESDYGADSLTGFAELVPDLVTVDKSRHPPVVRLLIADSVESASLFIATGRVREDVWTGILDNSSGTAYVWDPHPSVMGVRPSTGPSDSAIAFPTQSPKNIASWRGEFIAAITSDIKLSQDEMEQASHWRDSESGSRPLPGHLRRRWNAWLKRRVLNVAQSWLKDNGLDSPEDLIVQPRQVSQQLGGEPDLEVLRRLVIRIVERMTKEELLELRLPPAALLRRD